MKKLGKSVFPAASHRMNLPPCNGIKRVESTDLTNKAVAGATISSVADWIGEIKRVWPRVKHEGVRPAYLNSLTLAK